jgi:hypothetical protein
MTQNGVERRKVKFLLSRIEWPSTVFSRALHVEICGEKDAPVIPRETRTPQRSEREKPAFQSHPRQVDWRRASAFMAKWSDGEDGLSRSKIRQARTRDRKKKTDHLTTQRREIRKLSRQHENDRIRKRNGSPNQVKMSNVIFLAGTEKLRSRNREERARSSHPNPLATTGRHFLANGRATNERVHWRSPSRECRVGVEHEPVLGEWRRRSEKAMARHLSPACGAVASSPSRRLSPTDGPRKAQQERSTRIRDKWWAAAAGSQEKKVPPAITTRLPPLSPLSLSSFTELFYAGERRGKIKGGEQRQRRGRLVGESWGEERGRRRGGLFDQGGWGRCAEGSVGTRDERVGWERNETDMLAVSLSCKPPCLVAPVWSFFRLVRVFNFELFFCWYACLVWSSCCFQICRFCTFELSYYVRVSGFPWILEVACSLK